MSPKWVIMCCIAFLFGELADCARILQFLIAHIDNELEIWWKEYRFYELMQLNVIECNGSIRDTTSYLFIFFLLFALLVVYIGKCRHI